MLSNLVKMIYFTSHHLGLIVILLCVGHISSQVVRRGTCPKVKSLQNFDVDKMVGVWYLRYMYYYAPQAYIKCSVVNMTVVNHNGQQELIFTERAIDKLTGGIVVRQSIKIIDPKAPARSINNVSSKCFNDTQQCEYVSVNYSDYYVIYCCKEYQKGYTYETLGIRTRNPENSISYPLLERKLRALGINPDFMYPVETNCRIYP